MIYALFFLGCFLSFYMGRMYQYHLTVPAIEMARQIIKAMATKIKELEGKNNDSNSLR